MLYVSIWGRMSDGEEGSEDGNGVRIKMKIEIGNRVRWR